ncbi:RHS repeat-associated core domain-containing protein [Psychrobacter aestuarii]|uniref:RHS repeat protein n=1 Tax=Psychrobacter aestuarii TaxID=556327 RepID=A0ABN0VUC2_9GAMM
MGNTQRFFYNDKAQLTETINPLKHATKYSYDDKGNIIEKVLANGSRFKFEFDDSGNLVRQTDCSGYSTEYVYDEQQRIAQVVNAEGQSTRYHYDDSKPWLDSLVRQVDYPDGNTVQMQYNDLGQVTKRSANNAKEGMTFDYDIDGLLSKQTNEAGYSLTYAYDSYRRLYELTNENNEYWYFSYDKGDNLIAETRFDSYQSRYTYDALGHLTTQTDNTQQSTAQQRRIVYERDLLGQLRYQSSSSGDQTERTDYTFNKLGQLLTATNEHSQISLTYDANVQLIKEKQSSWLPIDGIEQKYNLELQHHYDEVGNRIKTILPDGKEINQLYYGSGHLYNQSLFDPNADQHIELRHSERNKLHLEVSRQQGVLDSHYHYDTMGRLLEQSSMYDGHTVIQRQYRYDAGQLTQLTGQSMVRQLNDIHPNKDSDDYELLNTFTRHHQYQYDVLGRLTEHKFNNSYNEQATIEHFAFDPASNRVSVQTVDDIAEKAFAHHGRPSELIQNNQRIRYVYDTHGRVHHKAITSINATDAASSVDLQLHYNANNELKRSVRIEHKNTQITETQTTYYYDAFGRRITKYSEVNSRTQNKEQSAQVSTTQYEYILWDGDLPIQAYSNRQVYTTVYDQGSFVPVARLMWLRDDLSKVANDDFNQINHEQDSSAIRVYHYHNDQLGTPNELTNEKGEVVWLADYEAWGNTAKVICHEQMIGNIQVSQNELQPIRFQGQHFDEETGLHYNRFRYYDPDMGMFTTRDSIELMGGNNVFQYAPTPTGWVDPLGLEVSIANAAKTAGRVGRGVPEVIWQAITPTTMGDATFHPTEEQLAKAKAKSATDNPCTSGNCCPPCNPVKGTIGYRPDSEGSAPHYNKPKDVAKAQALGVPAVVGMEPAPHFNMSQMNQNPKNCQCFWKSLKIAVPPVTQPG